MTARLVVCDLDTAALEESRAAVADLGAECLALRCDVSDRVEVDGLFEQAGTRFGTVDFLVSNAARAPNSPAEVERRNRHCAHATTPVPQQSLGIVASLSDEDWLTWWGVNMHGVFRCARAALRFMEPQRSGQIVKVASVSALGAASVHGPGCSASKAGVIGLARTTAHDAAGATEAQRNKLFKMVPAARLGVPEEYANVALVLAVFRVGDAAFATDDACPHAGGSLANGPADPWPADRHTRALPGSRSAHRIRSSGTTLGHHPARLRWTRAGTPSRSSTTGSHGCLHEARAHRPCPSRATVVRRGEARHDPRRNAGERMAGEPHRPAGRTGPFVRVARWPRPGCAGRRSS